jgi:polysaccharide export outer membrane protein
MQPRRLLLALLSTLLLAGTVPARADSNAINAEKKNYIHRLALADRLRVGVYQEEDLTTLTRIDARGRINLPLLGEIAIGGMTIVEAQTAIENAYKDGRYLRNPQVTINVEEYAQREVSIQGQIRNPGRFSLPPESTYTVVELVTKAGGITDIGKGTAVTVTRIMPDGTKKVFTIDVDSIIKGKKDGKSQDLLLQAGDNVYVPERLI